MKKQKKQILKCTNIKECFKLGEQALLPIILLVIFLFVFMKFGPLGVFKGDMPPLEKILIQRVIFTPEEMKLLIFNDGPEPVTISQVMINDVYWKFDIIHNVDLSALSSQTLKPLDKAVIVVNYPWVEGDTEHITLVSSTGVTFDKEVAVAFLSPHFSRLYLDSFILLGLYIGVIPVFLGLLWFPFLRNLSRKWFTFLISLSIGILVFLGFDALGEALILISEIPEAMNGIGIVIIGFIGAVLVLGGVSYITIYHQTKKSYHASLCLGYLIALGIGIHNLGEGLAVGSAYALGEIALGSLLVIGFMIHNITEGIPIISPLTKKSGKIPNLLTHLIMMGLIAGGPTIIGTLIGGFSYSVALSAFFLAFGAGSIFTVVFDILQSLKTTTNAENSWKSVCTVENIIGFIIGLLVMYVTGFMVVG
ncbi:metal transporter [Candidatus Woesearchaeota archaeon]|nr:metal transporter [Candidatus Woesearchaeota archaeon]